MSSIMDLKALGFMELGSSSRIRVRIANRGIVNQYFSCFISPNTKSTPSFQIIKQPLTISRSSLLPSNACLPSCFHRDCALRIRARATRKDDDTGDDSSGETKDYSDLSVNMSPLDPNYIEYGLIYYTVLFQCCDLSHRVSKDGRYFLRRIIEEFSTSDGQAVIQQTRDDDYDYRRAVVDGFLKHKFISHDPQLKQILDESDAYHAWSTYYAKALMFVEVIHILKFNLLQNLAYTIENFLKESFSSKSEFRANADSKTLVAKSAVGLSTEFHKIYEAHTKLMEKFKLVRAVRSYMNLEEENHTKFLWDGILLKFGPWMGQNLEYILDLFYSLKRFNDILMRFCECKYFISSLEGKQMMQTDDLKNVQENLRLANIRIDELILVPHNRRYEMDVPVSSLTNMAVGFERSLIAYRNLLRMIPFNVGGFRLSDWHLKLTLY